MKTPIWKYRWKMNNLNQAEIALNYNFNNKDLLRRALTAASASDVNNQLLEFFGDAILEFIVTEKIFSGEHSEGELTELRKRIVSDSALAPVSVKLGLDKLLIRGKNDNNNKKAIPSVYEAVVAAIYLDGGMEAARNFVLTTLNFRPDSDDGNYKGRLQELLQGAGRQLPVYSRSDVGNETNHFFSVKIELDGNAFCGEADSVKKAEQLAAKSALEYFEDKGIK